LDTVITVVGAARLAVDVACRLLTGNASETFKNRKASRKRATNKRDNMVDSYLMSFERAFKVNVEPGSGGFSTLWLTDVRRKRRS